MILLAIQIKYARVKARKEKLPFKTAAFLGLSRKVCKLF
ncbi:Hypothetical protein ACI5QM_03656 [Bacillus subtilis]